ncbi:23S rRNA pseudouridine1911/1915/1917 synthase [Planomicrobium koreense]|uniref:Pseudouridine synthase n=1 Tax=Planococcus koreensis TaxID=112331 RepID=A0A7W8CPE7_9BACL|nr:MULTISPECIES: RluA family pseudouridine synthase [Planococcus]MBB5179098.1 23S rRNA pseudouridine1911/1915/1917 synthase [Planococcus koreensis]MDN3450266.1 RluA family pseudouridine synthase [Planococcus sp. APC 3906]
MKQLNPFQLTYAAKENGILREALSDWGISKRTLASVKYGGGLILVNGAEVTVRHIVEKGDAVTVIFPLEELGGGLKAEPGPLKIIHEDEALLIVDKPALQNTIPSREHPGGSLANFVAQHFEDNGVPATLHIATRLDRDTSGLVCIAKNRHIHHMLSLQQQSKRMKRQYEAFVHGTVGEKDFLITEPIGRKDGSIIEREVRQDGKFAETAVEVLHDFEEFSHLRLQLNTGRTHQIRVHLSHIGHPLIGDDLYGGSRSIIERQALHCRSLELLHPVSGEKMFFESLLHDDMAALLQVKR